MFSLEMLTIVLIILVATAGGVFSRPETGSHGWFKGRGAYLITCGTFDMFFLPLTTIVFLPKIRKLIFRLNWIINLPSHIICREK